MINETASLISITQTQSVTKDLQYMTGQLESHYRMYQTLVEYNTYNAKQNQQPSRI